MCVYVLYERQQLYLSFKPWIIDVSFVEQKLFQFVNKFLETATYFCNYF